MLPWLLLILAAYLIGSIPFGVLLTRTRGVDIREHGSKNVGAAVVAVSAGTVRGEQQRQSVPREGRIVVRSRAVDARAEVDRLVDHPPIGKQMPR